MRKRTDTPINLFIDKLDKYGVGISLMQNENVCLVPYTLPGERVKANIINKFKSKMYCSNLEILENSSDRSNKTCEHFTKCGGCLLQHWQYENYKQWKFNLIRQPLLKLTSGIKTLDMISADNYSRRRAKFFLRQDNNSCKLGFKKYKSETLININNCIIIDPEIMGFMSEVRNAFNKSFLTNEILIFHVNKLDYGLDILIKTKKSLRINDLIDIFKNFKSKIISIYYQQNNQNPELILFYNKNKLSFGKDNVYGLIPPAGFGFDKALNKIGVDRRIYTAGKNKSLLDPFSPENKDDIKRLKNLQTKLHDHFISFIKLRRGKKIDLKNKDLFTGMFWSGQEALELGLIDGIGQVNSILKDRFGNNVKIKEFQNKKRFFDLGNLISITFEIIANKIEEKLIFKKFGL